MKKNILIGLSFLVLAATAQANPVIMEEVAADIASILVPAFLIETIVVISLLGLWRSWGRCAVFMVLMHFATIPFLLFVRSQLPSPSAWWVKDSEAECVIVLVEAALLFFFAAYVLKERKRFRLCALSSFLGNLSSYLVGIAVVHVIQSQ